MVVTQSSFEDSTAKSPTDGPPREVHVETVNDNDGNSVANDGNSVASAPNPTSVARGLGARFRNAGPTTTPKKVMFDTVAWLAQKAKASRDGLQGNTNESPSSDGRPDNGGNGSESASGHQAPDHANTPATGQNLPPSPRNGLPAADQLDALKALIEAMNPRKAPQVPPTPRIGGVTNIGAWTGRGAGEEGLAPRTTNCYRKLCGDEVKSLSQLSYIESHCRAGLKGINGPLFCQEHEPDEQKTITVLIALESFLESYGIEGVFIVQFGHSFLNMLKSPNGLDEECLDEWIHCLTISGVDVGADTFARSAPMIA